MRSGEAADRVAVAGAQPVIGDMTDAELVRGLAAKSEGVIHTASPGDATSAEAEAAFAGAVLAGISDGVFVRTGGVWVHGSGVALTEETPRNAPPIVAWREEIDRRVLAASGVRAVLIEPGVVYGHGGGIPRLVAGAERAGRGEVFLGVGGADPTTRELGEAASLRLGLGGRVAPEDPAVTVERLGEFGRALLLDQQADGGKARRMLGWRPSRPSLLEEIAAGGYDV